MPSILWKPSTDAYEEVAVVTVASGARAYTFEPGVSQEVPPEDYASLQTALKALQGTVAAPASPPTITTSGTTGAATWGYKVAAVTSGGDTQLSTEGTVTTGNATLTNTNYNIITKPTLPSHASGWRVIRTTSGGTPAGTSVDISGVLATTTNSFNDQAVTGSAYSAAGSAPSAAAVGTGPADE